MEVQETQARTMAKWWADHLRRPAKMDNGGDFMSMALAVMAQEAMMQRISPEDADRFEDALVSVILQRAADDSYFSAYPYLGVDYSPDRLLSEAAESAGVKVDGVLPWKSGTSITRDGRVVAVLGYRGTETVIG